MKVNSRQSNAVTTIDIYGTICITRLNMHHHFGTPPFSPCTLQCKNAIFKFIHLGEYLQKTNIFLDKCAISVWMKGQTCTFNIFWINVDVALVTLFFPS